MHLFSLVCLLLPLALAEQVYQGFNYDAVGETKESFTTLFNNAKKLAGTSGGFTSARLFTMIQDGSGNKAISAIPAAIETQTSLLLGLWYNHNVDHQNNEIAALQSAIEFYGNAFAKLVVGISVGNEDLYRNSVRGFDKGGPGADPKDIVEFITRTRETIKGTMLESKPVGHVDTYQSFLNESNAAVISAIDFVGMDAYPYWQDDTKDNPDELPNDIAHAPKLFESAHSLLKDRFKGRRGPQGNELEIWVTETGWPFDGPKFGSAETGWENAEKYWDAVGCGQLFGKVNTWWYSLKDRKIGDRRFRVTEEGIKPLYDLTCPAS